MPRLTARCSTAAVSRARASEGERAWLVMDGMFYQSDVWLDGSYLGDTEGYFFPHSFDVTAVLTARSEHLLAVEVGCARPARPSGKKALLGVWGDENCIDPAYNPGGIWAPVRDPRERAGADIVAAAYLR